jgi:hypothetical protein
MLKADSGPGRMSTDFFAETAVADGTYFFPGLPNVTESGQEMDQLFAAFTTCVLSESETSFTELLFLAMAPMLSFHLKMLGTLSLVARSNCPMTRK